jgi:pilus assembly protein Flp/PilA
MRKTLKMFVRDDRGVSAMEYAILAGIVAVALALVGANYSATIQTVFTTMFTKVTTAQAS